MDALNPLLRLRSLSELRLRRARLIELLARDPEAFGGWLAESVEAAHDGDDEASLTLVAWSSALVHLDGDVGRAVGEEASLDDAGVGAHYRRLLEGPSRHRRLSPRVKLEGGGWLRGQTTPRARTHFGRSYVSESSSGWQGSGGFSVSYAERARIERERDLARGGEGYGLAFHDHQRPTHDILERAYRHDDPRFRARLLERTWLVERDVVLMAALRPSTEAMLLTIARSDRWFFREAVRDALCNNPYAPSWLVGSLLPAAKAATRRGLLRHPDPSLRRFAEVWEQGAS